MEGNIRLRGHAVSGGVRKKLPLFGVEILVIKASNQ